MIIYAFLKSGVCIFWEILQWFEIKLHTCRAEESEEEPGQNFMLTIKDDFFFNEFPILSYLIDFVQYN